MNWLLFSSLQKQFPQKLLNWFVGALLKSGDLLCICGKAMPGWPHTRIQMPLDFVDWKPAASWRPELPYLVLIAHDGESAELDHAWAYFDGQKKLYGVLYDTGVLVAGPAAPSRTAMNVNETGRPADFQAVCIPTEASRVVGSWSSWLRALQPDIDARVQLGEERLGLLANSITAAGKIQGTPAYFYRYPDSMADLRARVRAEHLSRVAILDDAEMLASELDARFSLLRKPSDIIE